MAWADTRTSVGRALSLLSLGPAVVVAAPGPATAAGRPRVAYHQWTSGHDFAAGSPEGVRSYGDGALTIARPVGTRTYRDPHGGAAARWEYARWTSPAVPLGFRADRLVPSWTADTPHGTWLQVELRGRTVAGADTRWYALGRWAADDPEAGGDIHRTSVPVRRDENGDVEIDTFVAGKALASFRLRVTLYRRPGRDVHPVLRSVGAVASASPRRGTVPAGPPGGAGGVELPVPRYSQAIHKGEYPRYDNGGEAWCSPTSTAMVISYWKRGPSRRDLSWVDPRHADPQVDHAARNTYDHHYRGAGNWPFNIAYAGRFGLDGFVTRLRSVTELEWFIRAGVPVVTSQSFTAAELPGAGYGTKGHLFVVVGFTRSGDPIVNDPAAASDAAVRRVYPRAAFAKVWLRDSAGGGIAYVIHPPGHRLPPNAPGPDRNW